MKEDLIKRSDAIKELGREYPAMPMFKSLREEWAIKTEGYRKAEEVIMRLPSADRPQGEWIDDGLDAIGAMGVEYRWHKCSQCGFRISKSSSAYYPNFCEACGARMNGEREGE